MTALGCAAALAGCFYPPRQKPIPDSSTSVTLATPYDLTWEAVHTVIRRNGYNVIADDPNNGIIETQAVGGFSLKDADCGKLKGIAGQYQVEPDPDSSAVYNFQVKAQGNEASMVNVQAVFTAALHIPMRPMSDERCVSRRFEESRLLKEISEQAKKEHRPEVIPPAGESSPPAVEERPRGGITK
jgi:hypothetical protein